MSGTAKDNFGGLVTFQLPDGSIYTLRLDKPSITIGRSLDNDVVLNHPSVSRHHARIIQIDDLPQLEDLGSSNGTFVEGNRLPVNQPSPLPQSGELRIGHVIGKTSLILPTAAVPKQPEIPVVEPPAPATLIAVEPVLPTPVPTAAVEPTPAELPVAEVPAEVTPEPVMQTAPEQPQPTSFSRKTTQAVQEQPIVEIEQPAVVDAEPVLTVAPTADSTPLPTQMVEAKPVELPTPKSAKPTREPEMVLLDVPGLGQLTLRKEQLALGIGGGVVLVALVCLAVFLLWKPFQGTKSTDQVVAIAPTRTPMPTMTPIPTPLKTCPEQNMILISFGGSTYEYVAAGQPPPSRPIQSVAFLDLPFPYDGGNENFGGTLQQFLTTIQRNRGTGTGERMNSFYDHLLPLYPGSKDPNLPGGEEPIDPPYVDSMVLFDGSTSQYDSYSGHPGLDFSTFAYQEPTTPVFAAADGEVWMVGIHKSGAYYVKIKHTVPNVGDFLTVYWHLHPDPWFEAMRDKIGQKVTAGTRIGTMGNTGFSTGHHLHFEVLFDLDQDGYFSTSESLDPFGFIPSERYPSDPWGSRTGIPSYYLWIHPMGMVVEVPDSGGGALPDLGKGGLYSVEEGESTPQKENSPVCAGNGSLPPGGTVYWSLGIDPKGTETLEGVGSSCSLTVFDANKNPVSKFSKPIQFSVPIPSTQLDQVDISTLQLYWRRYDSDIWEPLQTSIDLDNGTATSYTDQPGQCALMGKPVKDLLSPSTQFMASGVQSGNGVYYDQVTITLMSDDPSGIEKIEYSLDGGTTWKTYTGPFKVLPSGIPVKYEPMQTNFSAGGVAGMNLILASAVDKAGNREEPPAMFTFAIDPSEKPAAGASSSVVKTEEASLPPEEKPINQLTGKPCEDPSTIAMPPVMVSVSNFPVNARPQSGLSYAPMVWELSIGEGMTRFLALFYCNFPEGQGSGLGPVRSGRLPYEELRRLYQGFLVMAGADTRVITELDQAGLVYESNENDMNTSILTMDRLKLLAERYQGENPPNLKANIFDDNPPPGGSTANRLWIYYNINDQIDWRYNPPSGSFLRWQDEADETGNFVPATDKLNGEQLAFENVIVMFVDHTYLNKANTLIQMDILYQQGDAYLFRDGQVYKIKWSAKANPDRTLSPVRYLDDEGNPFPLKPGRTWVQIVDLYTDFSELEPGTWKVRFYTPR
jgi:hypothetical protein